MAKDDAAAPGQDKVPGEGSGDDGKKKDEPKFTEEQFQQAIKDRVGRLRKEITEELQTTLRGELLANEAFRTEALKEWKVEPTKPGDDDDKLDDDKVREHRAAWEEHDLKPIQTELADALTENEGLRLSALESKILTAAGPLVQPGLLEIQGNGHSALFNMVQSNFKPDKESKEWRVMDLKGEPRPSPTGQQLYMTPEEFLKGEWAENPVNAPFITDQTQTGSDYKGGSKDDGKRIYTRAEYKSLCDDTAYYGEHREELLRADTEGRVRG